MEPARHWIAVASAEHVALGQQFGILQVCHGKAAALRRIAPGDRVIAYSPTARFRGTDRLQAFTAIGTVRAGLPYQGDMAAGFRPWRRDMDWLPSRAAPIRPLLDGLVFARGGGNWGYRFRFGLFAIDEEDAERIATAMRPGGSGSGRGQPSLAMEPTLPGL